MVSRQRETLGFLQSSLINLTAYANHKRNQTIEQSNDRVDTSLGMYHKISINIRNGYKIQSIKSLVLLGNLLDTLKSTRNIEHNFKIQYK